MSEKERQVGDIEIFDGIPYEFVGMKDVNEFPQEFKDALNITEDFVAEYKLHDSYMQIEKLPPKDFTSSLKA